MPLLVAQALPVDGVVPEPGLEPGRRQRRQSDFQVAGVYQFRHSGTRAVYDGHVAGAGRSSDAERHGSSASVASATRCPKGEMRGCGAERRVGVRLL